MRTTTRYTASCGSVTSPVSCMRSRTWLASRAWDVYGVRDLAWGAHGACTRQNLEAGRARFLHGRPAWVVA